MGRSYVQLAIASLAYAVILEVMLFAAIRFFPNFEEHFETLRLLAGISSFQGIMTQIEEGGVVAYVCGQQFFKGCNTLGTAAAVLFAVSAIAGEVHRGTFELWLARPYSRARLLAERYAAGALATVLPVFATSATIPALCDAIGEDVRLAPMMWCSVQQGALLLAVYSVTFLASSMGSNPTRIALIALFATTFSFAIYMVEVVTHWSIYRWTDIEVFVRIAADGELPWGKLGTLLAISAGAFTASVVAVRRRVP
jgi:ABC-type transport system involved in multi-copper enzyme maturation permease subunit